MAEQKIGVVIHYYGNIGVAAIQLAEGELRAGDVIRVRGSTSDFSQHVDSIQIDGKAVEVARAGDAIGLKVIDQARERDEVYKVTND